MQDCKVSIIVPAYNTKNYIGRCIEHLLNQTYVNIEVIIVDDGSTDDTCQIVNEFCSKDSRVKNIRQNNQGTFAARNRGVKEANGKYILFVDSDDYIETNTIERLVAVANQYHSDIVRFRYKKIPDGYAQYLYYEEEEKHIEKDDFRDNVYPFFMEGYMLNAICTNFIRKDKVPTLSHEQKMTFGEDLLFNLELYTNANNVTFISDTLYTYVSRENSTTKTNEVEKLFVNLQNCITVYNSLYHYIKIWNMDDDTNRKIVSKRIVYETASILSRIKNCKLAEVNMNQINIELKMLLNSSVIEYAKTMITINDFEHTNKYYAEISAILKKE